MGHFNLLISLVILSNCTPNQCTSIFSSVDSKSVDSPRVEHLIDTPYINPSFLMGKFEYTRHQRFQKVPNDLSSKSGIYVQKEVLSAFTKMHQAAKNDKVSLIIISGTRNFTQQKGIWEKKWEMNFPKLKTYEATAKKILEYSSMPSTSRHHWGTDIDINSLESDYFKSGKGKLEYEWLTKNGPKYGFYQVYTSKKNGRTGYSEEEWHWSYLPLANIYLSKYNTLINLNDIKGFKGFESARKIDVIKDYVNGIECYD